MVEKRNAKGQTLAEFLAAYDVNKYPHPSVTADTAAFTLRESEGGLHLCVALVCRGNHPDLGRYALPGGFLNMDETSLEGAARELMEETGIAGVKLRRFGVYDALNRDPRTRVITIAHYGLAPLGSLCPQGGDDAAEASLFEVDVVRESWCPQAETYRILLVGKTILRARAQIRYDELGSFTAALPKSDAGLASDHDHVLFGALLALNNLPRERAARLLTLGHPKRERAAIAALENALGDLPQGVWDA
ncbi:MAG: NUDIX hydrolase [Candidatus Pelethousia sp.]|nr:NUDIX hydrolase [Candidatus Pelethousia sp.]